MKSKSRIYLKIRIAVVLTFLITSNCYAQQTISDKLVLPEQQENHWWVGIINQGDLMPIADGYQSNMYGNNYGNQIQPLLISANGDYIWSEHPLSVKYQGDSLMVESMGGKLVYNNEEMNLKAAYLNASKKFFPPSGKLPDLDLVRFPQYNTWIELMYDQNQEDILKYAKAIVENGFPPGVIMIDDNWQEDYGNWNFHPDRFANPKMMMDSLHKMGFKVMLWICPFVSPDSRIHRSLAEKNALLKDSSGRAAMIRWWNGTSSCLDFSNPAGYKWFNDQLKNLVNTYGADGFKFDAGDAKRYNDIFSYKPIGPNEHSRLFGLFGLDFPLNEYRAMWKMGGQPLVQRLRDKGHDWRDLHQLIPHILLQGIMGYPFTCPDMIGGGQFRSFLNSRTIDQELIVRSAQSHALMPMMQFSVAPWRVLDEKHLEACKLAVEIRQNYLDRILQLTKSSAQTGEPVVRSLEYVFPHQGYEKVEDQFMLGNKVLVCPMLEKGKTGRTIVLPKGRWRSDTGKTYKGPTQVKTEVPLHRLPVFEKL